MVATKLLFSKLLIEKKHDSRNKVYPMEGIIGTLGEVVKIAPEWGYEVNGSTNCESFTNVIMLRNLMRDGVFHVNCLQVTREKFLH